MKRAWTIFERLASTMPDRVTIRELVLYFHVRRTIFVDLLFHSFANYENDKRERELELLKRRDDNIKELDTLQKTVGIDYDKEEEILDIIVNDIRFSVIGKENIVEYCETDDIKTINEKNLIIMRQSH